MDHNTIHQLIDQNGLYEVNTIQKLEQYLQQQLSTKTYDYQANKSLLQYYQVYPNSIKLELICNILILSLMRLPSNDFLSLVYMLPPKCIGHSRILVIQECANFLEKGRYTDFWEEYISAPENLFTSANGFVDFIRRYILGNLRDTYTAMPSSLFAQQLGLNESSVDAFCNGTKFIDKIVGSNVIFAANEESKSKAPVLEAAFHPEEGLNCCADHGVQLQEQLESIIQEDSNPNISSKNNATTYCGANHLLSFFQKS